MKSFWNNDFCLNLKVAEYLAGIGLVRMGLESAGWQIIWANDFSNKKYEMYEDFFPNSADHYFVKNIFEIDPTSVPQTALATCSFPCIDLSVAGNMNGIVGQHSSAFWGFIRILKAQEDSAPPIVLVENVPGWLYSNKGEDFRLTIQALNELGYACDVFTLDALRFTPQSRLRIFVVGTKLPLIEKNPQLIFQRSPSLLSNRLRNSIFMNLDLDWFYNELPEPPPLNMEGLSKIIEDIGDNDDRWWNDLEVKRHIEMMEPTHHHRIFSLSNNKKPSYRTFFRRRRKGQQRAEVRPDDLSGCLRTAIGGSGKQFLIKVSENKIRMRAMTPREYARLQGVPDSYPIKINGVQSLTGFGDAVCVPAITWIAKNVLNPLVEKHSQITQEDG